MPCHFARVAHSELYSQCPWSSPESYSRDGSNLVNLYLGDSSLLHHVLRYVCPFSEFIFSVVDLLYLDAQLSAIQREFLSLENTTLSHSRRQTMLQTRLLVARASLEEDIVSYNALESECYHTTLPSLVIIRFKQQNLFVNVQYTGF